MTTSTTLENKIKEGLKKLVILAFWLIIWKLTSLLIGDEFLLPSPISVLKELSFEITKEDYWIRVGNSTLNLGIGLILSSFLGISLAILSLEAKLFKALIKPFVSFLKAVPIVCFVIILLIWLDAKALGISVSFIMGFPLIYEASLYSLENVDKNLLDMAKSFRASRLKTFIYIYLPSAGKAIKASVVRASAFMFKACLAAELIGLTKDSIGEAIYYSKIYLDSRNLIMWTISIIILSSIYEKILKTILGYSHDRI